MRLPSAPPTSLVPADTRIFAPTAHGSVWLALGIAATVGGLVLVALALRPLWSRRGPRLSPLDAIKIRHLGVLDDLAARLAAGRVDGRAAHHELSRTMRRFARDVGAPGAPAMSTAGLRAAGLGPVATVVDGYVVPQFHPDPDADPALSLARARDVIAAWSSPDGEPEP